MARHQHPHGQELHDRGLAFDLSTLLNRRHLLTLFAGVGAVSFAACTGDTDTPAPSASGGSPTGAAPSATASGPVDGDWTEIPEETAGPFPGDGSNGPDVLRQSGIVRRDIRSSFGTASGVAQGVPLTINLTIVDSARRAAFAGAAVYLWHCDREGRYSLYSSGATAENYLRGVQVADGGGALSFTTVFPAAYQGRWPHIHFEVYPSLAEATASAEPIATSQLALPEDICTAVYASSGYAGSVRNLAQTSLATDNVFRDGWESQLAAVTGSVSAGYVASLRVPV